jgi:hypothetical protein
MINRGGHSSESDVTESAAVVHANDASAATVQQAGIALGAATAGLVANASGLDNGLDPGSVLRASLWVPLALVAVPLAAAAIGVRLNRLSLALPSKD